nr:hypothetical protein [Tanacetum cinerariifolium]
LEEEQAVKAQNWKLPVCYDDDDDEESSNSLEDNIISEIPPYSAITPNEPTDSLSMGDEHLDTIPAMESDEFIKSCVENLEPDNSLIMGDEHLDTIPVTKSDEFIKSSVKNRVSNPSESEGEYECDVPACEVLITFSNILFDVDYDFYYDDNQSFSDEDISKEIYSNPLFDEEIISMKIDPHHFNAESDLIESLLNHDSSIISSSSKIDSLFDEFVGELTLLKSIPPRINETDCDPENETRFIKRLLYDNSSPRPPEGFISKNSDAFESFSPSPIPVEDSDSLIEEI